MLNKIFIAVLFALIFTGCEKKTGDNGYVFINGSGLVGKWVATEVYVSPGAGGTWNALPHNKWFVMEFRADSSFTYSPNFPKADSAFSQYRTAGTVMNISSTVNNKTDHWYYQFDADGRLSLGVFLCFEGCAYGLRRIE